MKTTALTNLHITLGAKMVPFAGYNMPVSYSSITDEHMCVRQKVGIFDVSHMGQFIIRGSKALELIEQLTSNKVAGMSIGKVQYTCLLNDKGGIVDDMLVYHLQENGYMLVVNAANIDKDWAWLQQHCPDEDVEMLNISERTVLLAVQGPKASEALQALTDIDLGGMKYYTFKKGLFAGVENVLVSATGYTGSGGFEIYFDEKEAEKIWNAILETGKPQGIQPIGLGARNTLRLEKGFCLYGNDISDDTTPLEASLGWITKLDKDFKAKPVLLAQKKAGISRRLVGFELEGRGIARQGYDILNEAGEKIGVVTSGTQSPMLKKAIGMGYVAKTYAKSGTKLWIQIRKKQVPAITVKRPFV